MSSELIWKETRSLDYGSHARLAYAQRLASRHALQNRSAYEREWKLDRRAAVLLSRLESQGPMRVGELAEAFRLDVSTVHRQIAAAMKAGLIERIPDLAGGHVRKRQPTGERLSCLHSELEHRAHTLSWITNGWREGELDTLVNLLSKYNQSMEELRGQHWPRPYPSSDPCG